MSWVATATIGGLALGGAGLGLNASGAMGGGPEQYSTLSPIQQKVANPLSYYLRSKVGKGAQPYKAELTAPMNIYEKRGLSDLDRWANQPSKEVQWGSSALQTALSGKPSTDINPQMFEDFYQNSVRGPALKEWREDLLPTIRERYNAGGLFYGTPREKAENKGMTDLEDSLLGQRSDLAMQMELERLKLNESAAARQLGALPQGLAYGAEPLGRAQALMTAGAVPREAEQNALTAQYQEWLRNRPEYSPLLDEMMAYIGEPQIGYTQQQPGADWLGALSQLGSSYLLGQGLSGGTGTPTPAPTSGYEFQMPPYDVYGNYYNQGR